MSTLIRQLEMVFATAVLAVGAVFLSFATLLVGKLGLPLLIWIWSLATAIFIGLGAGLLGWFSRRTRVCAAVTAIFCAVTAVSLWAYESYENQFHLVRDDLETWNYRPFGESGKLATLTTSSTLLFTEKVPKLDGATALYPLYAAFAQATYPSGRYSPLTAPVQCTKTGPAYEGLIRGDVDLIFVSRPSKKQIEAAKQKGLEFNLTPIGREAFVFFVNAKNPVRGVAVNEIQGIYSGTVSNWNQVGGDNRAIKPFQRPEGSGSQTMLQKIMDGRVLLAAPQADVAEGMGGIIRRAADYKNYPGSIGYSFLFFATEMVKNKEIRLLEINGIAPSTKSILDQSYPFSAEFYAVTIKGKETPQTTAFIEWILSPQGQSLVSQTGYVALR
jgi:phosphate transport system substrate-binding protein